MADTQQIRKAALMLSGLPDDMAALLMTRLAPQQLKAVSDELRKIGPIAAPEQHAAIAEFTGAVSQPAAGPQNKLTAFTNPHLQISAAPFGFLAQVDSQTLLRIVAAEQPQTIAAIACFLSPLQAAEMIAGLSHELQSTVVRRIATIQRPSRVLIRELETGLIDSLTTKQQPVEIGGLKCVLEIIERMDSDHAQGLLNRLALEDPQLASQLGRPMPTPELVVNTAPRQATTINRPISPSAKAA